jgi:hypothetical protein
MRLRVLFANAVVLAGITWVAAVGTEKQASKLLPSLKPVAGVAQGDVTKLEDQASRTPTVAAVSELVMAYLDRNQPGLASAVIDRAPVEIQRQPEVAQLRARALFQRGRARDALAAAKEASDACASRSSSEKRCPAWLVAKSARQLAFFEQVVAAGIEDPYTNPEGTKAAYERSAPAVRLVAMQ